MTRQVDIYNSVLGSDQVKKRAEHKEGLRRSGDGVKSIILDIHRAEGDIEFNKRLQDISMVGEIVRNKRERE